ncbi:quinoprotein glucose dehydrogenase [Bacillus methanolicus]|uniref:PQQ-dependent sugar dehydrogenase n=1 Tax=Bacillus methanolicus TaxID=1471 RepID=UPI0023803E7D|nr:PQQ-dependent sugar dehydrogenase [Bacillus methanolicus]MDE3840388.1 quinoprotein glucose dehydrogenase [Bacillus methanolicus]
MKKILLSLSLLLLLFGCSNEPEKEEGQLHTDSGEQETVRQLTQPEIIAGRLEIPWSINKTGNTFYISERTGSIVKIENGKTERQNVKLRKRLAGAEEAGFLGFVLAPDFSKTNKAFAYYTYEDQTGQFNQIVELVFQDGEWNEQRVLLDKIPSGQFHHGGRLEIGPDGKLYATAGDGATNPETAQDPKSLGGKILRLNLDGSVPDDNPISGFYTYSYGHRNPQGLAWSPDGTLYESEHGPSGHDEINLIKAGGNYGWPVIMGEEKQKGMIPPLFQSGEDTWAPSGMVYHNGKLYVATLRGIAVKEFDLEKGTTREVVNGLGRIRDVFIEGNDLYFISNNTDGRGTPDENDDKLYKISLPDL